LHVRSSVSTIDICLNLLNKTLYSDARTTTLFKKLPPAAYRVASWRFIIMQLAHTISAHCQNSTIWLGRCQALHYIYIF
jgi:hypothetical protein